MPRTTSSPRPARVSRPAATSAAALAPTTDAIATRAYEIFLQRGAEHGRDWDDWLAAERELTTLLPPPTNGSRAAPRRSR